MGYARYHQKMKRKRKRWDKQNVDAAMGGMLGIFALPFIFIGWMIRISLKICMLPFKFIASFFG